YKGRRRRRGEGKPPRGGAPANRRLPQTAAGAARAGTRDGIRGGDLPQAVPLLRFRGEREAALASLLHDSKSAQGGAKGEGAAVCAGQFGDAEQRSVLRKLKTRTESMKNQPNENTERPDSRRSAPANGSEAAIDAFINICDVIGISEGTM